MKLRIDATPEELETKAPELVKSLGEILRPVSPEMADILEKAIPRKESELKFPVTRTLQKKTEEAYEKQMKLMIKDIGKVLDRGIKKSEDNTFSLNKAGPYIGPRGGKWADPQHTIPWKGEQKNKKFKEVEAGIFTINFSNGEDEENVKYSKITIEKFSDTLKKYLVPYFTTTPPPVRMSVEYGAAQNTGIGTFASYDLEKRLISIKSKGGHGSLYHEYAHFLDHYLSGKKNVDLLGLNRASEIDNTPVNKFVSELKKTESYRSWKHKDAGYVQYLQSPQEVFARYVDQWFSYKIKQDGGDPSHHHNMADEYYTQSGGSFSKEDIAKTSPLFERLMGKSGMRIAFDNNKNMYKSEKSPDYTTQIVDKDEEKYNQVKQELLGYGYVESDFEEGGPLHGYSTNQLIDLARDKRDEGSNN